MSDGSAALDPDRLPWLSDEPAPRGRRRWHPLLLWSAVGLLLIAALSYWLGTSSGSSWSGLSDRVRTVLPAPAAPPQQSADESGLNEPLHLPPMPDVPPPAAAAELAPAGDLAATVAPAPIRSGADSRSPPSQRGAQPQPQTRPTSGCPAGGPNGACGEGIPASLDQHLAALYSQSWAEADPDKRAQLLRSQDRFVARLEQCRSDSCRRSVYLARTREVSDIMAGQWQPPQQRGSANPEVARLDRRLSALFSESWQQADAGKRARLLRSHDRFLDRLEACRSVACANSAYVARMREVSEIMSRGEGAE